MISGFISLLSPLNAQDTYHIVWGWSYSCSTWGINNLVSEGKIKRVKPVYGSLKTTMFTSTSCSVVTRVACGDDSCLPELLEPSCVHLSHWQKLECWRPQQQFLRNREKKKENWMRKSWTSLRLKGQGPGVKARRGEERLKRGVNHRLQSPEKWVSRLLLCIWFFSHRSELENYRGSAAELPATLALYQLQRIEGVSFSWGSHQGQRLSLRWPWEHQRPSRLENPAVVNAAVAPGIAKEAYLCRPSRGAGWSRSGRAWELGHSGTCMGQLISQWLYACFFLSRWLWKGRRDAQRLTQPKLQDREMRGKGTRRSLGRPGEKTWGSGEAWDTLIKCQSSA